MMRDPRCHSHRWLNLDALARQYLFDDRETLCGIYYFTALCPWDQAKQNRHKRLLRVYKHFGINIVLGEFRPVTKTCRLCRQEYSTHEEKLTDVNIAIKLFELALADSFDTAFIISGDSDLAPAILAVKREFPAKQIGVIVPIGGRGKLLQSRADFTRKMRMEHLRLSVLPATVELTAGQTVSCPSEWM